MNSARVGHVIFLAGGTVALYILLRKIAHSRSITLPPAPSDSRPECPTSTRQPKGVRLCQVYPPPGDDTATDIDIIAIHGLDTKSPDTWTWEPRGACVNWLDHQDMLPRRFPTARIFTCDWPADLLEQPDIIQKTIEEFARLLLAGIKSRPPVADTPPGNNGRPIVFVASCLGGVVLMKALVMASDEYLSVKEATRGIVFLATPFRGTSFQYLANWAEPGLRAWASISDRNVSNLLGHVQSTFELGELVRSFTSLCRERDLLSRVYTFYETGKSSLPRKIAPWLPVSLSQEKALVDRLSATLDFVPHPIAIDRPHVLVNKFGGPDDPGYVSVTGVLEILLCDIRNGHPVEKADVWIRNRRYSPKELQIERLSGDLLPMDQCYINLAIIEQPKENFGRSKGGDTSQKSSPFSLLARLKLDKTEEGLEATLPHLFQPRETRDGPPRRPCRILIRGRAGVGKTTLCKKIVYEFTHGNMWRDLFDHVLWVPLRNLKLKERRQVAGYNFGNLFQHEYFSQHPEGSELAKALWHAKNTKSERVLFLLDGLDEVSQDLDGDMYGFLQELLNQPSVIITSRPNAMLPAQLEPLDLQMETTGFHPEQVTTYIENAFTNRETGNYESGTVEEIQAFLHNHQLMQSLLRIPIQLDAFCYTWNDHRSTAVPETMTAVYRVIGQNLWKKDATNLEKRPQRQIKRASSDEIYRSVENELSLLEVLAFTGMLNDVIDFEPKHLAAISRHFGHRDTDIILSDMLGRVSFLRTSDPSSEDLDRNYHFLHLTFQEYFAAQYFVRQWTAEEPLDCLTLADGKLTPTGPANFLREFKYNPRYDILWRFSAGLFDARYGSYILPFFKTIEEEPRDVLGPTHQRLVMHCLSEVPPSREHSAFTPFREGLEDQLSRWLLFECRFTGASQLARETELPKQAMLKALLQASEDAKAILFKAVSTRPPVPQAVIELAASLIGDHAPRRMIVAALDILRHASKASSKQILIAITARLEHPEEGVRAAALYALRRQSTLSDEILIAVTARLEDPEGRVRAAALDALRRQSTLSDEILIAITARLEHPEEGVRAAALDALRRQSTLSDEILIAVTARLEDPEEGVRAAALHALRRQSTLSNEIRIAITARLEHPEEGVRAAALDALQSQSTLSDKILIAITARLEDPEEGVRAAALDALRRQSTLSDEILVAITARLEDPEERVKEAALLILMGQPHIPLLPNHHVKLLFRGFLRHSFNEHISWHTIQGISYITQGFGECRIEGCSGSLSGLIVEVQNDIGLPL